MVDVRVAEVWLASRDWGIRGLGVLEGRTE